MDIKKLVACLIRTYKTKNPFDIARSKNIWIAFEDLGTINGYYKKAYRQKQIHINYNLSASQQKFVCAHELGHALLHPSANTPFLRGSTSLLVSKLELEANTFAIELLLSDDCLLEYQGFTIDQIGRALGYNQKLIELKMKHLNAP